MGFVNLLMKDLRCFQKLSLGEEGSPLKKTHFWKSLVAWRFQSCSSQGRTVENSMSGRRTRT